MKLKTEMRRSDKIILDMEYVESILKEAPLGILSLCKDDNPYSIPVNFYYDTKKIYVHCAKEGRKVQYVKANPFVCFLVLHAVDVPEPECGSAMNYESVLCFGKAQFFETSSYAVLEKLSTKYGECSEITEEKCQKTALIVIDVEEVSAKRGFEL